MGLQPLVSRILEMRAVMNCSADGRIISHRLGADPQFHAGERVTEPRWPRERTAASAVTTRKAGVSSTIGFSALLSIRFPRTPLMN